MSSVTEDNELDNDEEEEDDDTELRDLVTGVLQANGVLGKIKAQLRANVFLALENGEKGMTKSNAALSSFLATSEGRLVVHLVREFLTFFGLGSSLSVFDPEVLEGSGVPLRSRADLVEGLGLAEARNLPLLAEVLRMSKVAVLKSETPTPTDRTEDESSVAESLNNGSFGHNSHLNVAPIPASNKSSSSSSSSAAVTPRTTAGTGKMTSTSTTARSTTATRETPLPISSHAKDILAATSMSPRSPTKDTSKTALTSSLASSSPSTDLTRLSNLPPLTAGPKTLAPLKKTPTVTSSPASLTTTTTTTAATTTTTAAAAATSVSANNKFASAGDAKKDFNSKDSTAPSKPSPSPASAPTSKKPVAAMASDGDDAIDEELDEFMNSSGPSSASADFTRDDTASEAASLKADYVEKV